MYTSQTSNTAKPLCALLLAFCGSLCIGASAQTTTADILGAATDPSGARVLNAHVETVNEDTGEVRTAETNSAGEYVFSALQIGRYTVTLTAPSFKTFSAPHIELSAGDRVRVDAHMSPGSTSENVTVTDITPALQTDSSTVGDVVPAKAVQDLPLNGRNYVQLVQLAAGVNAAQPGSVQSGNRNTDRRPTQAYSANGQSELFNNNLIDGMDNNERTSGFIIVRPSVDAIQEISVFTSNYPAEVGRAGGAVVNVLTKAGSNQFHGDLFEYFRNDALDARDFFARVGRKPELRQNQFGGSAGGPIRRDKTFFFGDVEETRRVNSLTGLYTVPTAYQQANPGDFTDIGQGKAPVINPIALAYFKLYPLPNQPGLTNNFQGTSKTTQNILTVDGRVDQHFGPANTLFVRYAYNQATTVTPSALPTVNGIQPGGVLNGIAGTSTTDTHNAAIGDTHIFSPNLLAQFRVGYTRYKTDSVPLNYGKNFSQQLGVPNANIPSIPGTSGLTNFYPIGYTPLGDAIYLPDLNTTNVYQANGTIIYTHGSHALKAGAALIKRESDVFQSSIPVGGYAFSAVPGLYKNSLLDMFSGNALVTQRSNTLTHQILEFWEPSVFVQDDYRATQNLTLNLGVRYEAFPPPSEKRNRLSNFDLATLSLVEASASNRKDGISTGYGNVSPRVGFALSLPKQSVLRGGFGISFFPADVQSIAAPQNVPYVYSYQKIFGSINTPLPTPAAVDPATIASNSLVTNLVSKDPNFRTSYIEEYNLEAQKQFGEYVATVGYVGQLGRRRLWQTNVATSLPPGPGAPTPPYRYAKQFPYVTSIMYYTNAASSAYNALQVQFQRRASHGVTVNGNYTYARGLDNAFSGSGSNGGPVAGPLYNDPSYDYGNSDLDIRHRAAAAITYELPFGQRFTGWKAAAVRGWQLNSIGYWQTGLPFTVTNSVTQPNGLATSNQPGVVADRPNMLRNAQLPKPGLSEYFDITAFQVQTVGTAGNEHRNQIYGPHDRRLDISAFKSFTVYREAQLQFRAECFNVLNIANFSEPNSSITAVNANGIPTNAGGFGTIGSTNPAEIPRQIQFALRFQF